MAEAVTLNTIRTILLELVLDRAGLQTILAHSISDRELEQAFEGIDAAYLLLAIDACNSGQALEAEEKRRGPMNSKGLAQLAYEKGMYILTAAQGYQAALETAQLGHGYLTYALIVEGLKNGAADTAPKDGQVLVREWLDYATERVPQMQNEKTPQVQTKPPMPQRQTSRTQSARRQSPQQKNRKLGLETAAPPAVVKVVVKEDSTRQQPRVFYRREPEAHPFIVARP